MLQDAQRQHCQRIQDVSQPPPHRLEFDHEYSGHTQPARRAYGLLSKHKLLQNNALIRSPFCATEAPSLFWHIKQCQEIQVIADNPYTPMKLMTNAVQLLMTSRIFPMRKFKDWDATPNKRYNSLKIFVYRAYARQLVAIQLCTTGQQGYVANQHNHNMYKVLEDGVRYPVSYHYPRVVTCDFTSRVTALTQNHPIGRLESPFPHGNNVAHNLVTT
jgi:hypothetical protein